MTRDEFLEALRHVPGWYVEPPVYTDFVSLLRRHVGGCVQCPITAVAYILRSPTENVIKAFEAGAWERCAQSIGLPMDFAEQVMLAADGQRHHNPALRRDLLEACGVS